MFEVLSDGRRRAAIACLADRAHSLALADLAEAVADREHDRPFAEIPDEAVRNVYMSLYHTHVPKLEDAGIVEYEQDRDLVWASDAVDRVEAIRSFATDGDAEP